MNPDLIKKIIRFSIVGLIFFPALRIIGIDDREAQQIMIMLVSIGVFSLILRNIWITLFIVWTLLLYSIFKFETGLNYVTNIFIGSVLYYLVKLAFKREHLDFFIKGFLWFVVANLSYMILQAMDFDFYFMRTIVFLESSTFDMNKGLYGFMGSYWALSILFALAIPILASKGGVARVGAILLFYPLYLCNTSLALIMGIVGFMFILWFQIPRKVWVVFLVIFISCGVFYAAKIDTSVGSRTKIWKRALIDASKHPIIGLGLDSFRNKTKYKPYKYMQRMRTSVGKVNIETWDNPHNLPISLYMEFSLIGLLLFCGYVRGLGVKFKYCIKSNQVIGLAGFAIVFLGVSFAHFPIFLARFTPILIPGFGLLEVSLDG